MLREIDWRIKKLENDFKKNMEYEKDFDINNFKIHEKSVYNTIKNNHKKLKKECIRLALLCEKYEGNIGYYSGIFHAQALEVENHIFNLFLTYFDKDEVEVRFSEKLKFIEEKSTMSKEQIKSMANGYDDSYKEEERSLFLELMIRYNDYYNMLNDIKKIYECYKCI